MDIFGSSGTRGVAMETLTPSFALRVAQAAGTTWAADRVAVARDTRPSGVSLANAVASGLSAVGVDVDRLGVVPTPAAQRYAAVEGVPVIVVTASHNPPEYNGIKLFDDDGAETPVDTLERVEARFLSESFADAGWDDVGRDRSVEGIREAYVEGIVDAVDRERIADGGLTVALDPGHGTGGLTSPELFRRLGCRVHTVNAQPDGTFPGRHSEPVPEHLEDLCRLVRSTDADVGIAHDGDADRATFVDETGEPIDAESSFAALAAATLEPGDVTVSAVNVSQRYVDAVEAAGARLELAPIGATHLVTLMRELRAEGAHVPIAGEGNGGIFFPPYRMARDGGYTAARFLELVAERPASELVAPYDGYVARRYNAAYDRDREREAMLAAAASWAREADGELDTKDGYRVDFGDAWALVRPSGTEPLVRAYAEARDAERAETLVAELRAVLDGAA